MKPGESNLRRNRSMPSPAAPMMMSPARPGAIREPRGVSKLTRGRHMPKAPEPLPASLSTDASGALMFELTTHGEGVHIMRVYRRDDGVRVFCSVLFDDESAFVEWLDSDTMRFSHPLVFQQVRRYFAQLMAEKGNHDTARK